tara:strand:- start:2296 stop:2508 length:213 start_codon:yes stop_codon:yes gene_type:complete
MKWQPIDTAPKDGTEILVYGRSKKERWQMFTVVFWQYNCWTLTETGGYAEDSDPSLDPTHWMPLPDPPEG